MYTIGLSNFHIKIDDQSFTISTVILQFPFFHKTSQLTNFLCFSFIEVKSVSFPISDLEQVVVQCFFDYTDLVGWTFQIQMNNFSSLI